MHFGSLFTTQDRYRESYTMQLEFSSIRTMRGPNVGVCMTYVCITLTTQNKCQDFDLGGKISFRQNIID